MPLNALQVKNAKPGRHADGKGLYLLVKPSGARSWVLRVQADGKRRDFGLGPADLVTLAEARVCRRHHRLPPDLRGYIPARLSSSEGSTCSARPMRTMLSKVTLRSPRSMRPMCDRSMPAACASASWDIERVSRS